MAEENIIIDNLNTTLLSGCEALERMGVPYVLTGGTLLGIYRDGHLMPHDYDVDVDILIEDAGADFLDRFKEATGSDVVFHDNYFTVNRQYGDMTVPFDVFLMFKRGNKRYKHFYQVPKDDPNNERCLIWPEDFYDKKKWTTIKYLDREFPVPHNTEKWLEIFFGNNWKEPVKDWRWPLADNCHIFGEYKEWE